MTCDEFAKVRDSLRSRSALDIPPTMAEIRAVEKHLEECESCSQQAWDEHNEKIRRLSPEQRFIFICQALAGFQQYLEQTSRDSELKEDEGGSERPTRRTEF